MDVTVVGAEKFGDLARQLRQAGRKDLQRELFAGINRSVRPLTDQVKSSTGQFVPDRYAGELTPSLRVKTRRRSGNDPAVTLTAEAQTARGRPRNLSALNRGRLRHPLFGSRRHWFNQAVTPRFWDQPLEQGAPRVREELLRAINAVIRKVERSIG